MELEDGLPGPSKRAKRESANTILNGSLIVCQQVRKEPHMPTVISATLIFLLQVVVCIMLRNIKLVIGTSKWRNM